ncbi:hypothetical protein ACFZBE_18050 [Streptomyces sp. NPDC008061]|uniref:hypothetical protein n=1 Tax=Streptomyces sp. NPDC008061 TaxID=3364805 RepID=UPI0036F089B0
MTVLRLIQGDELSEHREALCEWLKANDIDPMSVRDRWISIELVAGSRVIRYRAFKVTTDGRRLVDPDDPTEVWSELMSRPLKVDRDLPAPQ